MTVALVARGFSGPVMVVQQRALVEERRLGRIQIFSRRLLIQSATAERDDPAGAVPIGNISRSRKRSYGTAISSP